MMTPARPQEGTGEGEGGRRLRFRFHRKCRWLTLVRYVGTDGKVHQKDRCRVCNAYRENEAWDPTLLPPIVSRQWM